MTYVRRIVLGSLAALALACGGNTTPAMPDSGGIVLEDTGPGAVCGPPAEPYGTSEGRNLRPFTLTRCDGTPYEFYSEADGYCEATFSVIIMSAGWCTPCRAEAGQLESALIAPYAPRGVRVVQALIQDNDYAEPSAAFCQSWVDEYSLTFPVVMDPTQITQLYFPGGSIPGTLIVDSRGVIRHREYGTSSALRTITAALDELLAAEGM